jgi:multiple sugar transport system permease protein
MSPAFPEAEVGRTTWWDRISYSLKSKKVMDPITALFYVLPAAFIIFVFRLIPIVSALLVSFYDAKMGKIRDFTGLENYSRLVSDSAFWHSLVNTVYFVIFAVPPSLFLALFLAVLLNKKIRGLGFYRTVYFLPTVTSAVAIAMVWKWIFHPRLGLLNYLLSRIHMTKPLWLEEPRGIFDMAAGVVHLPWPDWFQGPSLALIALVIVSIWKALGYNIVIFLAGLQNIPEEYYEAATIDGASGRQVFWNITWPLLSPTTFYVLLMTTIVSFQVFSFVYLMTGPPVGAPLGTTKVIVYYLFEEGFDAGGNQGYASAVALVLFLIILSLTLLQRRLVERRVHY